MMAQKYGKYPHIIYEIYNEPMEDSWESVKEYATDIILKYVNMILIILFL